LKGEETAKKQRRRALEAPCCFFAVQSKIRNLKSEFRNFLSRGGAVENSEEAAFTTEGTEVAENNSYIYPSYAFLCS
jgi:hypothetical protein